MSDGNIGIHAVDIRGAKLYPGLLDPGAQCCILADVNSAIAAAPLLHPETRWGKKMSVGMTSAGRFGWISDRRGYRYEPLQPSGAPWPAIPQSVLDLWAQISGADRAPECCLINHYRDGARMGLHQDKDEADTTMPVVSFSLGDDALFRIGTATRGGPTESVWLSSGDVIVLGGPARMAYHGVDRIRSNTSRLLENGGRINLTLRVVT